MPIKKVVSKLAFLSINPAFIKKALPLSFAAGLEVKAHARGLWFKVKGLSLIKPLHFGSSYLVTVGSVLLLMNYSEFALQRATFCIPLCKAETLQSGLAKHPYGRMKDKAWDSRNTTMQRTTSMPILQGITFLNRFDSCSPVVTAAIAKD